MRRLIRDSSRGRQSNQTSRILQDILSWRSYVRIPVQRYVTILGVLDADTWHQYDFCLQSFLSSAILCSYDVSFVEGFCCGCCWLVYITHHSLPPTWLGSSWGYASTSVPLHHHPHVFDRLSSSWMLSRATVVPVAGKQRIRINTAQSWILPTIWICRCISCSSGGGGMTLTLSWIDQSIDGLLLTKCCATSSTLFTTKAA